MKRIAVLLSLLLSFGLAAVASPAHAEEEPCAFPIRMQVDGEKVTECVTEPIYTLIQDLRTELTTMGAVVQSQWTESQALKAELLAVRGQRDVALAERDAARALAEQRLLRIVILRAKVKMLNRVIDRLTA